MTWLGVLHYVLADEAATGRLEQLVRLSLLGNLVQLVAIGGLMALRWRR